uniref:Uncharacterized protein n=1 Tax=Arundo donax TaxID=35708 RepID=A0A0A9CCI5_ARUDO
MTLSWRWRSSMAESTFSRHAVSSEVASSTVENRLPRDASTPSMRLSTLENRSSRLFSSSRISFVWGSMAPKRFQNLVKCS